MWTSKTKRQIKQLNASFDSNNSPTKSHSGDEVQEEGMGSHFESFEYVQLPSGDGEPDLLTIVATLCHFANQSDLTMVDLAGSKPSRMLRSILSCLCSLCHNLKIVAPWKYNYRGE